jgi:DNA-binding transcriptional MerR regulator
MHQFTIKDIENLTGIKAHTIRIWEKRYAFFNPLRSNTNIRSYSVDELKLLLDVSVLNKYGLKISHIAEMPQQQREQNVEHLKDPDARNEVLVNKLIIQMIMLDIDAFDQLLHDCILQQGTHDCIHNIILPFLEKTDLLCSEHKLHKAQEHILVSVLRKKLINAILLLNNSGLHTKTVLMFLPEGNYDEIDLLLMQYLIQQRGLYVIYLGTNVPVKDVLQIASYKKPDYIYTMLNKEFTNIKADKYIEKLSLLFDKYKMIITGKPLKRYEKNVPKNIQLSSSASEAMKSFL